MKFGSLFSGIGGLDLGLERAGMECVWQSEIDPYACKVLTKHWPDVPNLGDIKTIKWEDVAPVDLICGGFPCQDISVAGKGAGIAEGTRSGLWFEFAEAIRVLRPRYVLIENVRALLVRGGCTVLAGLAACGYDAEWTVLRAGDFGAPHRRERVFLVAYPVSNRVQRMFDKPIHRQRDFEAVQDVRRPEDLRDRPDLPKPLIRGTSDGIPDWMDRLKCLGNAVVPQVAEYVGRCIMNHKACKQP